MDVLRDLESAFKLLGGMRREMSALTVLPFAWRWSYMGIAGFQATEILSNKIEQKWGIE